MEKERVQTEPSLLHQIDLMFGKQKIIKPVNEQSKEKPTPWYLRDDYPYKAAGKEDLARLKRVLFMRYGVRSAR